MAGSDVGGGGGANQEAAEWVGRERVGVGGGEGAEGGHHTTGEWMVEGMGGEEGVCKARVSVGRDRKSVV